MNAPSQEDNSFRGYGWVAMESRENTYEGADTLTPPEPPNWGDMSNLLSFLAQYDINQEDAILYKRLCDS